MATPMVGDNLEEDQLSSMTTDNIVRASRLLDNEIRILKKIKSANFNQPPPSNTTDGCSQLVSIVHLQSNPIPAVMGDANDKGKRKSESAVLNVEHNLLSSFKRCKRKTLMRVSFPEEMVFNILMWLPAQIIHDVMRYVCRRWYAMIRTNHVIYAHLLQSTGGFIILQSLRPNRSIFVAMRQGRIEISKLPLGFGDRVWTSCNGLVLVCYINNRNFLYVVNPITKQRLTLPPFFPRIICHTHAGLAFVVSSMEYKVVYPYGNERGRGTLKCAILTIGVDKVWRHIDIEHLACLRKRVLESTPLITGGFMHWVHQTLVSTLNVQTETFVQFPVPQGYGERVKIFIAMGSNLSFATECGVFSWEIWEMKPETGEWTKLPNIDLEAQRWKLELVFCTRERTLRPVGWLKSREVLVFRVSHPSNLCIAYDIKTQEIQSIELEGVYAHRFIVHVNSLVRLEEQ